MSTPRDTAASAPQQLDGKRLVAVAAPDVGALEERYVVEAMRSSWISSTGGFVDRFEAEFAEVAGATFALGVCNGTVALHLALLALDVRPGDEVLVPSLTYVAVANAVRYVGGEPVFVDIDPESWCMDPGQLESRITRRTKGIVAVHLYGHPADMDTINEVAGIHGLWVVEDSAEAHFGRYKDRPVGALGRIGTFSFYGNKIVSCGEGGAVTTNDPQLALRMRTLRGQGVDPRRRYYFPITGYNFRLTNLACAILCAQLERREELLARRLEIFDRYRELLDGLPGVGFQPVQPWATLAPWLFCITIEEGRFGCSRDQLMAKLDAQGIETRPFFLPLHTLPPFREAALARGDSLPRTEQLAVAGLNLPTHTQLTDIDVDFVVEAIRRARP